VFDHFTIENEEKGYLTKQNVKEILLHLNFIILIIIVKLVSLMVIKCCLLACTNKMYEESKISFHASQSGRIAVKNG
jgi:hypothetical protein